MLVSSVETSAHTEAQFPTLWDFPSAHAHDVAASMIIAPSGLVKLVISSYST